MVSPHVVRMAVEYLDGCSARGERSTLVGMRWHIDAHNKVVPLLEEVNAALEKRSSLSILREDGLVVFVVADGERKVTEEDIRRADVVYREQFAALLGKLTRDA